MLELQALLLELAVLELLLVELDLELVELLLILREVLCKEGGIQDEVDGFLLLCLLCVNLSVGGLESTCYIVCKYVK